MHDAGQGLRAGRSLGEGGPPDAGVSKSWLRRSYREAKLYSVPVITLILHFLPITALTTY